MMLVLQLVCTIIKVVLPLLFSLYLCRSGRIDLPSAGLIKNTSYIGYQLHSYQVGIVSEHGGAMELFDQEDQQILSKSVRRKNRDPYWPDSQMRGIPASNWYVF